MPKFPEFKLNLAENDRILQKCDQLVKRLVDHDDADAFLAPVDTEALGFTDYTTVCVTPMDLETVQNKLNEDVYVTLGDIHEDIVKIWSNCMLYNIKGSPIWVLAKNMGKFYVESLNAIFKTWDDDEPEARDTKWACTYDGCDFVGLTREDLRDHKRVLHANERLGSLKKRPGSDIAAGRRTTTVTFADAKAAGNNESAISFLVKQRQKQTTRERAEATSRGRQGPQVYCTLWACWRWVDANKKLEQMLIPRMDDGAIAALRGQANGAAQSTPSKTPQQQAMSMQAATKTGGFSSSTKADGEESDEEFEEETPTKKLTKEDRKRIKRRVAEKRKRGQEVWTDDEIEAEGFAVD